jgi:hypothetical protein
MVSFQDANICVTNYGAWSKAERQERNGEPLEALRDTLEQALNLGVMLQPRSATTPIVDLFMSGAGFEARHSSSDDGGTEHPVFATIKRGLDAIHHRGWRLVCDSLPGS